VSILADSSRSRAALDGGTLSGDKTKLAESGGNKFMKGQAERERERERGGCIPRAVCARHAELSLSLATRPGSLSPSLLLFLPVLPLSLVFFLFLLAGSFLPCVSGCILLAPSRRLERLICVARPSESISRTALISAASMNFNRDRARPKPSHQTIGHGPAKDDYSPSGDARNRSVLIGISLSLSLSLSLFLASSSWHAKYSTGRIYAYATS